MRVSIDHKTGFRYSSPVASSYNEARMIPLSSPRQTVWTSRVSIEPSPWSFTHTDYWGTSVTTFELHEMHRRLSVHAQSVVETHGTEGGMTPDQVGANDLGWAALRDRGVIDSMAEFLTTSDRTEAPEELAALAADAAAGGAQPRQAALAVCGLISDRLSYARGSTSVTSTAAEVWAGGTGVCQDFSHLALAGLRAVGIPARYVSGYRYPADAEGGKAIGESHSWIEWWGGTWVAYDPTLASPISDHYIRVGHGRDYGDVAPLRGTYSGGTSEMFVTVEMTLLG